MEIVAAMLAIASSVTPPLVTVAAVDSVPYDIGPGPRIESALSGVLEALRESGQFPGATAAVAFTDGSVVSASTGVADRDAQIRMAPDARMLQGSVGKTYVAAAALRQVAEGRLDLDAPISEYLGDVPWLPRLPNAPAITVRMLMNHTSGLERYEFGSDFLSDLAADPYRVWSPEARLAYLFDAPAPFRAGEGWAYSDSNYIVLGMILEKVTGMPYEELLRRNLLGPLRLENTIPSNHPVLDGVVQGYAGPEHLFGTFDEVVGPDGRLVLNPQFEWTGGGVASTAADLARWTHLLHEGSVLPAELRDEMLRTVPHALGPGVGYGLGVIVRETPLGPAWGHSGYFPGYLTESAYFPHLGIAAAIHFNTSRVEALGVGLHQALLEVAAAAALPGAAAVEWEVRKVVHGLFDAMRRGDGAAVSETFHKQARLATVGNGDVRTESVEAFAHAVGTPRDEVWDERLDGLEIAVDGDLAAAWMHYRFYLDAKFSHCGVNAMTLVRNSEGWRILDLLDTRRREGC
jgi:D-alanyl-D-alanine carboxypeptidase